jgi:hypothetical protein
MTESITIAPHFCGPPTSGNGGYCSGVLARFVDGTARVTLRKPIPLDRPLAIERWASGSVGLLDGTTTIAEAERAELALEAPLPPTLAQAEAAAVEYPGLRAHAFPTCYVCGPKNAAGLRIYPGPVATQNQVAAPWTPQASHADGSNAVQLEYVWAALDCPGYWAAMLGGRPRMAVLGQFTVQIEQPVRVDEPHVVLGWRIDGRERKHRTGTALFSADGRRLAVALGVWIELRAPPRHDSA